MTITFIVLVLAIVLLLSNRLRSDVVALLVMLTLGLSGVLTSQETFSGFSRSAVVAIIAIFILAEGLRRTGLTELLGEALIRLGGRRQGTLVFTVTLAGAVLSLFMNNIAAASVLMPAISGSARKAGISASRLLMPLAFGTILGGMATLLTTTNILVSGILRQFGFDGFGLLDFAPVGLPIIFFGTLYMALVGWRLLPVQAHPDVPTNLPAGDDLQDVYRLSERLIRARVFNNSPLVGQSLRQSALREKFRLNLIAFQRNGRLHDSISPDLEFKPGDILHLIGRLDQISIPDLGSVLEVFTLPLDALPDLELVELVLTPRSPLIGHTLRDAHFREKYGLNVIAIWREGRPYRTGHSDMSLKFGDALLLHGPAEKIPILRTEPEVLVLQGREKHVNRNTAILASVVMLATLVVAGVGPFPIGEVMLAGALAMVILRILNMDQAYRAVEWKSVFLVAGMLPLGTALTKTGAAALLSDALMTSIGGHGNFVVLAVLVGVTILFTQVMNGAAVAAILAPIAIHIAQNIGAGPRALAMAIALASSLAFITPLGHPVNILVMGPGGYNFRDYARVGLFLTLLIFLVIMVFLPVFWPLG
ncbi:MAG TPA: SLC13 family permease [Anaerolineales bacterium]|jgi:di/tricarboxylate transporter